MKVGQSSLTLCDPMDWPWDSPEKNTGLCCHSLFQGIFPTQGLNLGVLHCRQILYHLSYPGSHIKKNKIPRNKSKEGKELYPENYKTLMKPTADNTNKCRDTLLMDRTHIWRRQWHPTPALLPGKSHGRRSLVGCHLWGRTESDTTEVT